MTFCKALSGKQICMTEAGLNATKAAFTAKKAKFIAARLAKLQKFDAMTKKFATDVKTMMDVGADLGAEIMSSGMLMLRMGMNAFQRWDCQWSENGTFDGMCNNMPNVSDWFMKNGAQKLNKDVLKHFFNSEVCVEIKFVCTSWLLILLCGMTLGALI